MPVMPVIVSGKQVTNYLSLRDNYVPRIMPFAYFYEINTVRNFRN
jgi:hypothetical protein